MTRRPRLVCLLPARNCAADLPGYFDSVRQFADAVVALDDGSTDQTLAVLAGQPLVRSLLVNPVRHTYAGWDDAENRNRLLEAAAALEPDWVLSLDADERIDPGDARALRRFIDDEARDGFAYEMRVFRMVDSTETYDRADLWVGRLFSYAPGQRFPDDRLHLVPLPTSIPPERRRKTTFRIQHLSSLTEQQRRRRFQKYVECDPQRRWQADYSQLLTVGESRRWDPRPADLPPLLHGTSAPHESAVAGAPALSVVVLAEDGAACAARAAQSALAQCASGRAEVLVATASRAAADELRRRLPALRLLHRDGATRSELRNMALERARGRFVWYLDPHSELLDGSVDARIAAHEAGYAMVAGVRLNGGRRPSDWVADFFDGDVAGQPAPGGPAERAPEQPSYSIAALRHLGGFAAGAPDGGDWTMSRRLFDLGYGVYTVDRAVSIRHAHRDGEPLLARSFARGRAAARSVLAAPALQPTVRRRTIRRLLLLSGLGLKATARSMWRSGPASLRLVYVGSLPLLALAAGAYWCGSAVEIAAHGVRR